VIVGTAPTASPRCESAFLTTTTQPRAGCVLWRHTHTPRAHSRLGAAAGPGQVRSFGDWLPARFADAVSR